MGKPSRTTSPAAMVTPRTRPPCGAAMTCSIFIASTTAIGWPWRTASPTATWMATRVPWIGEATPAAPSGPVTPGVSPSLDHGGLVRLHPRVVREQRQRIAAFHPRPGEPVPIPLGPIPLGPIPRPARLDPARRVSTKPR